MQKHAATQRQLCKRYGVVPHLPALTDEFGIALQTLHLRPLNGLRQPPDEGTCGGYIWAAEHLSDHADFFQPLCVEHIGQRCPDAAPFLGLPAGWRFLIAHDYVDVWEDPALLRL